MTVTMRKSPTAKGKDAKKFLERVLKNQKAKENMAIKRKNAKS